MISGRQALQRLKEGNQRFVSSIQNGKVLTNRTCNELPKDQKPFAVVLGCSDARVPVEIIFDQGLNDLFVVRVAGNIATPTQIGSIEYAVEYLSTRLVVVLGHTQCGAVQTTLEELEHPTENLSPNLRSIVDYIRPSVEALTSGKSVQDHVALVGQAVRANIRASVDHLQHGSPILEQLIRRDGLLVVGAEHVLETGIIDFFDELP